jgi:hypothetical protein
VSASALNRHAKRARLFNALLTLLAVIGAPIVAFIWWFGWGNYWGREWAHPVRDAAMWTIVWLLVVGVLASRVIHARRRRSSSAD